MGEFVLYHYYPSQPAAITFVVLFLLSALLHIVQLLRRRTWYFIPFVIGCLFEMIGYAGRIISSTQSPDWTITPYIIQSLFILLAPALFAASIYMVLGRIILLTDGEALSIIRARWLTKLFVAGDVLSFLTQSTGGAILAKANSNDQINLGQDVIMAGLFMQVGFFGFFILVSAVFHVRIARRPTERSQSLAVPWQRHLLVLYMASGLILVRSVFRIVEYLQGWNGALLASEIYLYIFDATLMFLTATLFNFWHPGAIISRKSLGRASPEDGDYPLSSM